MALLPARHHLATPVCFLIINLFSPAHRVQRTRMPRIVTLLRIIFITEYVKRFFKLRYDIDPYFRYFFLNRIQSQVGVGVAVVTILVQYQSVRVDFLYNEINSLIFDG